MVQVAGKKRATLLIASSLAFLILSTNNLAFARKKSKQQSVPDSGQISMCLYPVVKSPDGQQQIITKAGYQVNIPGLGIASDAKQIALYGDGDKNFWYVDKHGHSVKMTDQQVEWGKAQIQQQTAAAQPNGMMHAQASVNNTNAVTPSNAAPTNVVPVNVVPVAGVPMNGQVGSVQQPSTVIIQNTVPAQTSSSGASSALMTGVAAAGGAMAGAALSNSLYKNNYYGVPYGQPIYHNGGRYYYNGPHNNKVYVAPNNHYSAQWNQQSLEHRHDYRKNQYNNLNKNQQQMLKNQAHVRVNSASVRHTSVRSSGSFRRH